MNHYETLFVVKPTLTDEEIKTEIKNTIDIIAREGGEVAATDDMGMRKLAYPVEKNERGYYTVVYYEAIGTLITELERQIRYNENIIKFMTVKYTNKKEIAQFGKLAGNVGKKQVGDKESPKETEKKTEPVQEAEVPAEETKSEE